MSCCVVLCCGHDSLRASGWGWGLYVSFVSWRWQITVFGGLDRTGGEDSAMTRIEWDGIDCCSWIELDWVGLRLSARR